MGIGPRIADACCAPVCRVWPSPALCRHSLALRHMLPGIGARAFGRLMRMAMNRSRARAGLPRATHAYCARSVRLRYRGTLVLEGGYRLEDNVELIMNGDGRSKRFGSIVLGHDVALRSGTVISADGGTVCIGERTYVGFQCVLLGGPAGLRIGAGVMLGPQCLIAANNHGTHRDQPFQEQPLISKGITIADNVWIGGHVTIVDGVSIGTGSVVAAGAVVTRDVPPRVLVAGVPSRMIRELS